MTHAAHDKETHYVVPRPQSGDAIGGALRSAFSDRQLPADMRALLDKLDAYPDHHRN